jgi:hypothetical protein
MQFIPAESLTSPSPISATPPKRGSYFAGKMGTVLGVCLLLFILCGGSGVAYVVLSTNHGPLATEPTTLKELAERLQARGMDIRWVTRNRSSVLSGGAIHIFRTSDTVGVSEYYLRDDDYRVHIIRIYVTVEQCSSKSEAHEKAGALKNAISYGRFAFYGDADMLEEIKSKL